MASKETQRVEGTVSSRSYALDAVRGDRNAHRRNHYPLLGNPDCAVPLEGPAAHKIWSTGKISLHPRQSAALPLTC